MRTSCLIALSFLVLCALGCGSRPAARPNVAVDDDELDLAAIHSTAVAARERIENPLYKSWSRFKVGTTITRNELTEQAGKKSESTVRYKLLELTEDHMVLESVAATVQNNGEVIEYPPEKLTNPRMIASPPGRSAGPIEEGEETVKVAGRDYKAKWRLVKGRVEGGETFTRIWISDEVPGGMVKSVSKVPACDSTTTLELTHIQTP